MDAAPLFHVGATLSGLVFALALVGFGRPVAGEPRLLCTWTGAALALDAAGALVALVMMPASQGAAFLYASLHALVPVLVLAGVRAAAGRNGQSGILLGLVAVILGWIGASMTSDLGALWVHAPIHAFRAVVYAVAAALAYHHFAARAAPLVWLTGAAAALAFGATVALIAAPTLMPGLQAVDKALLYGLALAVLVLAHRMTGPDTRAGRNGPTAATTGVGLAAVLEGLDHEVLVINRAGRVSWANAAARRLFEAGTGDSVLDKDWRTLLPGLPDRGLDLDDLPCLSGLPEGADGRPAVAALGRSLDGAELAVEVARLPDGAGPGGRAGDDTAVMILTQSVVSRITAMGRLSLEMDIRLLDGESLDAICEMCCVRLAGMEDAALVWCALRNEHGTLVLTAVGGHDHAALAGVLGMPLPAWLCDTLEPVMAFAAPRPLPDLLAPGARSPRGPGAGPEAADAAAAPEGAEPFASVFADVASGGVFPLIAETPGLGVLVVQTRAPTLDRGMRLRCDIVARRLASVTRLSRQTGFLRLQAAAMAVAANAIFITDREGHVEWANEAFTRLSGFSGEEVRGKTPHILFSGHQDPATYADLWATIRRGDVWRGELVERRKDGSLYTVQQTVTPMRGPEDNAVHYVAVHEDISERKRAEERIRYLSNYDTLTRLPNRTLFRDRLHQAVTQARRVQGTVAVLFVDLTQFSRVNDTLGHDVGDQILMTVGSRINAAVAEEVDAVARVGGDEFALIQSGHSGAEAAATLARRLARIIETPVEVGGNQVTLRATVGIAMYPDDGTDPDNLVKNADLAMHRVARTEGEDYRFFSNEMNNDAQVRLDLESDLRRALEHDHLVNFYQPQYDMAGTLVGMEALVRWRHPIRGLVPPGAFITVAEESGLVAPLGEGVLRRAVADIAGWRAQGLPAVPVAVNISAVQFRDSGLIDRIRAALDAHGMGPDSLDLELTESVLMGEHAGAVTFLNQLAAEGFRIAIDDFGTGYSSLSYLKRFPIHKLKIDQSFVRHLNEDTNDTILVRAIINLGHSLGMTVVAEGVETEEQFDYLRREGCDIVQGYLLGRPMPREDMERLLGTESGRPVPGPGTDRETRGRTPVV